LRATQYVPLSSSSSFRNRRALAVDNGRGVDDRQVQGGSELSGLAKSLAVLELYHTRVYSHESGGGNATRRGQRNGVGDALTWQSMEASTSDIQPTSLAGGKRPGKLQRNRVSTGSVKDLLTRDSPFVTALNR